EIINGIRYKINSAKIESANAMIKRIQSKACGIFDVEYLFLKLRQIYYIRLQKQTKMPMSYYHQI
ncbi:MAG: transposase, partial [Akkermansia sp.]|nr:transposase [Akkermansia sp.]